VIRLVQTTVRLAAVGSLLLTVTTLTAAPEVDAPHGLPLEGEAAEVFLRTAAVVDISSFDTKGVTRPRRATLTDGTETLRAVFKDIDEYAPVKELARNQRVIRFRDTYTHEIAAYELAKLLGLDIVPPCVQRRIGRDTGALCLWVEGTMTEWERLTVHNIKPPDLDAWNRQMFTIRLFLQLIYDIDYQNVSNLLVDPEFKVYKIDSSRAFRNERELRNEHELTRFSRSLLEALRGLTRDRVDGGLKRWLTKAQIDGLMARRDLILELAERHISERGEAAVLFP
jgi:hypothetical protein